MIKQVTIKSVKSYERPYNKEGEEQKPLYTYKKGKNQGKNFVMVTIQTNETGDEYYSTPALVGSGATKIKEGDVVILKLTETTSEDGTKVFKNFNFPSNAEIEVFEQFASEK